MFTFENVNWYVNQKNLQTSGFPYIINPPCPVYACVRACVRVCVCSRANAFHHMCVRALLEYYVLGWLVKMGSRALTVTGTKGVLDSGRGARDCTDMYELYTHTYTHIHTKQRFIQHS